MQCRHSYLIGVGKGATLGSNADARYSCAAASIHWPDVISVAMPLNADDVVTVLSEMR